MAQLAGRKARGMASQAALAAYLRDHGWPWATDAGAGRSGADVLNTPGLAWECKARSGFDPLAWLKQAKTSRGLPLVAWRPNGYGLLTIGDWPVMTTLDHQVSLLRGAGYGDPEEPVDLGGVLSA